MMSDTNLVVTVTVPVPTSRIEQAKILMGLADPLETFKKALPKGATIEDKVVTSRPKLPKLPTAAE